MKIRTEDREASALAESFGRSLKKISQKKVVIALLWVVDATGGLCRRCGTVLLGEGFAIGLQGYKKMMKKYILKGILLF